MVAPDRLAGRGGRGKGAAVKPALRQVAAPFVAAPPIGVRVRARLRVSSQDEAVLWVVGTYLGSLAGQDLAARCGEGQLDAKGRAASRAVRKRSLTAASSSRWAGAITRTSEDQYRLAEQNLRAERNSLLARIDRIETRLLMPVGEKAGRIRGYATAAERYAKTVRLQALRIRLTHAEQQLQAGAMSVVRGGKSLLRKRNSLATGLTEAHWRLEWESARLFLTADGEKDKVWGNETIRWNPDARWLEIKLPAPLAHLANRPHGRYRLSCPIGFSYRGDEAAAQAATGAIRYDISHNLGRGRWYIDASWKTAPAIHAASLDDLRQHPVAALDVNHGHLAVAVIAPDGNIVGTPATVGLDLAGLPSATRDGHLRAAISDLLDCARQHRAHAIVIEDLEHHPKATGHHAAALVIGRRGLGHGARRRVTGNQPAPAEAARSTQMRPRTTPAAENAPRNPATPRGPRQPPGTKTRRSHRTTAGNQAAYDRSRPPATQDYVLLVQQER